MIFGLKICQKQKFNLKAAKGDNQIATTSSVNQQIKQQTHFMPFNQVFVTQYQQNNFIETNTAATTSMAGPYTFPVHLTYPNARIITPTTPNLVESYNLINDRSSSQFLLESSSNLIKKIDEINEKTSID